MHAVEPINFAVCGDSDKEPGLMGIEKFETQKTQHQSTAKFLKRKTQRKTTNLFEKRDRSRKDK